MSVKQFSTDAFPFEGLVRYVTQDGPQWHPPGVPIKRGEGTADADLLNAGRGPLVVVSYQFDAGYVTDERIMSQPVFQVRAVGDQDNYDSARDLAFRWDWMLMRIGAPSVWWGDVRVSSISHSGSGPTLFLKDGSKRTHFTCSYVVTVPSGL